MSETTREGSRKKAPRLSQNDEARAKSSGKGVVNYYVHNSFSNLVLKDAPAQFRPSRVVEALTAGLPLRELEDLQVSLNVPMEKLVPRLGMSRATFHRRKAAGKLGRGESDRVVRYARLMGLAIEVMESEEAAREWLTSPQIGLGGAVPLDYAETEVGAREVEDLLGRIEYAVYS